MLAWNVITVHRQRIEMRNWRGSRSHWSGSSGVAVGVVLTSAHVKDGMLCLVAAPGLLDMGELVFQELSLLQSVVVFLHFPP